MTVPPVSRDLPKVSGVPKIVADAINNNTAGLRDLISTHGGGWGNTRTVDPNLDGSWPVQGARPAGGIIRWRRYITADKLADMPTAADGYRDGDEVWPYDVSTGTVLWSDSFAVDTSADFSLRTGDAYAGGAAPTWVGDTSQRVSTGRVRVLSGGVGLSFYSNVFVRATTPSIPTGSKWRLSFTITSLNDNPFYIPLRASAYNATSVTRLKFGVDTTTGELRLTLQDTATGSSSVIGQAPFSRTNTPMVIEYDGSAVVVSIGEKKMPTTTTPTALPVLTETVFHAGSYSDVCMKNVKLEVVQ